MVIRLSTGGAKNGLGPSPPPTGVCGKGAWKEKCTSLPFFVFGATAISCVLRDLLWLLLL